MYVYMVYMGTVCSTVLSSVSDLVIDILLKLSTFRKIPRTSVFERDNFLMKYTKVFLDTMTVVPLRNADFCWFEPLTRINLGYRCLASVQRYLSGHSLL